MMQRVVRKYIYTFRVKSFLQKTLSEKVYVYFRHGKKIKNFVKVVV